jgi:hypothetical protein
MSRVLPNSDRIKLIAAREVFRSLQDTADPLFTDIDIHKGLIRCHLQLGDLKLAWHELVAMVDEYRTIDAKGNRKWNGEPLVGKTLLILDEWGFGDSIQFIRYAKPAKESGGTIIIVCRPELFRLYERLEFADAVIARECPEQEFCDLLFDYYAPVMDLPLLSGPAILACESYFTVATDDAARRRRRLAVPGAKTVGIVWATGVENGRTKPVMDFGGLAAVPNVQCYSLQKGPAAAGVSNLPSVISLSDELEDFYETACAITALDLVITVDTSVAHLAGALGRPVWTTIVKQPSWRWFDGPNSGTPWYPSMRLYYETNEEPWPAVLRRLERDLRVNI